MKYLVLGSNSFAGATFVNSVLSQDEEVVGISRSQQPNKVLRPYENHPNLKNFTFHQLDLNLDFDQIKNLITKYKPHYIVDFAGQGMVAESWSDPAQWYLTNIVAKVKLHEFLKECSFLQRYVRVSTPEVYGNVEAKMREDHPSNPSTPYAVSHAAIDMSLQAFFKQYQFPVILARFSNFYGPHQQLYRIIPKTMICALLKKKLPLHGGGVSERMFIYADDVSSGIFKSIQLGKLGQIYHFSNGPCLSIRALVEKICDQMNVAAEDFLEIAEERAGKDNKYEMDASKSETELDWRPSYTLDQGLEKTIHWVSDNIDIIKTLPLNYIHKS